MNYIVIFFTICFITLVGYSTISLFNILEKTARLLKLSYSFGLGAAMLSFEMYLYSRLGIGWGRESLLIPGLILIILALGRAKNFKFTLPNFTNLKPIDLTLVALILFCVVYTVFEGLIRPPVAWDSWAAWLFQAKAFYLNGYINADLLRNFNLYYPLLFYLLNTFFFEILGKFDDMSILMLSSTVYFFLIILFFSFTKERFGLRKALLFTFLLASTQNLIRHGGRMEAGLADLPLSYFAFCAVTLILSYIKSLEFKIFALINIFLAALAMVKSEGLLFSFVIGLPAIYTIYKNKIYYQLLYTIFWIIPIIDWDVYKRINGIMNYFAGHVFTTSFPKFINSFTGTFKELINIKSWNLLWIIYFYSLIFKKFKNKDLLVLNYVVVMQLVFYVLIYIFTSGNSPQSSIERLLIHLAPIALLEIVFLTTYKNFFEVIRSLAFNNRKIMKFIDNFITIINRY